MLAIARCESRISRCVWPVPNMARRESPIDCENWHDVPMVLEVPKSTNGETNVTASKRLPRDGTLGANRPLPFESARRSCSCGFFQIGLTLYYGWTYVIPARWVVVSLSSRSVHALVADRDRCLAEPSIPVSGTADRIVGNNLPTRCCRRQYRCGWPTASDATSLGGYTRWPSRRRLTLETISNPSPRSSFATRTIRDFPTNPIRPMRKHESIIRASREADLRCLIEILQSQQVDEQACLTKPDIVDQADRQLLSAVFARICCRSSTMRKLRPTRVGGVVIRVASLRTRF